MIQYQVVSFNSLSTLATQDEPSFVLRVEFVECFHDAGNLILMTIHSERLVLWQNKDF